MSIPFPSFLEHMLDTTTKFCLQAKAYVVLVFFFADLSEDRKDISKACKVTAKFLDII